MKLVAIMTNFDLHQSVFDSDETNILSLAFAKAWAFVEFDSKLEELERPMRCSELARCLMELLKRGETNPTSLANSAIRVLRETHKSRVIKFDPRRKWSDHSGSGLGRGRTERVDSYSRPRRLTRNC